jgi:hypothetical protein
MGKKEFDEYIQTKSDKPTSDFKEQQLREWKEYLAILYKNIIEIWMADYIEKGLVTTKYNKIRIHEEFSGDYEVDSLVLFFHNKNIVFEPVGTMLVGAKGRVDIKSANGTVRLILVDKDLDGPNIQVKLFTSKKEKEEYDLKKKAETSKKVEWEWKIFLNNDNIEYIKLDENNFFDILMELSNG